jgi:hypothetical protein
VVLSGCQKQSALPPIASGLADNYKVGSAQFDARVKRRFPNGTSETRLLKELRGEGFRIELASHDGGAAEYSRANGCGATIWQVSWNSSQDRLMEVAGRYFARCL